MLHPCSDERTKITFPAMINLVVFVTSVITTLDNLLQMIWGFVTDTVRQFPFLPVYISDV